MNIIEAIRTRKSIRDFTADPVPQHILRKIIEVASRAPSAENSQPWEFTIVAGDILDTIRTANIEVEIKSTVSPRPSGQRLAPGQRVSEASDRNCQTALWTHGYSKRGYREKRPVDGAGIPVLQCTSGHRYFNGSLVVLSQADFRHRIGNPEYLSGCPSLWAGNLHRQSGNHVS